MSTDDGDTGDEPQWNANIGEQDYKAIYNASNTVHAKECTKRKAGDDTNMEELIACYVESVNELCGILEQAWRYA